MRQDSRINFKEEKRLARQKYAERQFDKWVKWSIEVKGKIKYKDILQQQKELKITEN